MKDKMLLKNGSIFLLKLDGINGKKISMKN